MKSIIVAKERPDGKYAIKTVSTAALADYEGETFTTKAMDYDIRLANKSGIFPEYRMFHTKALAFGKVTKMSRVGIFAVDEGESYTDSFSLAVCKNLLSNNEDGKWKVSRGFNALEVSGGCPQCGETLVVSKEHMIAGYRCPLCDAVNLMYKGVLKDVQFLKTRTFDITVTDVPAVPWTGASATLMEGLEEFKMKREDLKKKLRDAGILEDVIDSRLKQLSDEDIAAFAGIPDATVLKEIEDMEDEEEEEEEEEKDPSEEKETYLVLDPDVLQDFGEVVKSVFKESITAIVKEAVEESLADIEVDLTDLDVELKEMPDIVELKEAVQTLQESVDDLTKADDERLKEILQSTSPAGKLRIQRHKCSTTSSKDDEEEEDAEKKSMDIDVEKGVIIGGDGKVAQSMTQFLTGGGE